MLLCLLSFFVLVDAFSLIYTCQPKEKRKKKEFEYRLIISQLIIFYAFSLIIWTIKHTFNHQFHYFYSTHHSLNLKQSYSIMKLRSIKWSKGIIFFLRNNEFIFAIWTIYFSFYFITDSSDLRKEIKIK